MGRNLISMLLLFLLVCSWPPDIAQSQGQQSSQRRSGQVPAAALQFAEQAESTLQDIANSSSDPGRFPFEIDNIECNPILESARESVIQSIVGNLHLPILRDGRFVEVIPLELTSSDTAYQDLITMVNGVIDDEGVICDLEWKFRIGFEDNVLLTTGIANHDFSIVFEPLLYFTPAETRIGEAVPSSGRGSYCERIKYPETIQNMIGSFFGFDSCLSIDLLLWILTDDRALIHTHAAQADLRASCLFYDAAAKKEERIYPKQSDGPQCYQALVTIVYTIGLNKLRLEGSASGFSGAIEFNGIGTRDQLERVFLICADGERWANSERLPAPETSPERLCSG